MKLWAFKHVTIDNGRAFAITDGGRLLEGQLFSGQWRWNVVEITIPDADLGITPERPADNRQAHGRLG